MTTYYDIEHDFCDQFGPSIIYINITVPTLGPPVVMFDNTNFLSNPYLVKFWLVSVILIPYT